MRGLLFAAAFFAGTSDARRRSSSNSSVGKFFYQSVLAFTRFNCAFPCELCVCVCVCCGVPTPLAPLPFPAPPQFAPPRPWMFARWTSTVSTTPPPLLPLATLNPPYPTDELGRPHVIATLIPQTNTPDMNFFAFVCAPCPAENSQARPKPTYPLPQLFGV
jgi:hypothetical protein